MSKLLYVVASPQDAGASFSRKVADAFIKSYQETHPGDVVDTLDVWTEKLPEFGALTASWKVKAMTGQAPTAEELAERRAIEATVERFKSADKYLFAIPMWNFSIPYRMKHYFDVIIQPGMTFGFNPAKGYFGLLPSERPVHVIASRAGTYAAGTPLAHLDFQQPYVEAMFGFMGLTKVTTQLIECTAFGPQVSDPILNQAVVDAMKAAATF